MKYLLLLLMILSYSLNISAHSGDRVVLYFDDMQAGGPHPIVASQKRSSDNNTAPIRTMTVVVPVVGCEMAATNCDENFPGYNSVSVFGMQRAVERIIMQDFPIRSPRYGALSKYF
ncbi:MAG: hypothetical protein JST76_07300 [Bacteroidetes bacterium]|nr:hypothetical protein [Bacteroidota bacterium]